jgi:hypothetical protein
MVVVTYPNAQKKQTRKGAHMAVTMLKLTSEELSEMIDRAVEKKLIELLGDPDAKSTIDESLRSRLLRQKRAVAKGQRGEDFNRVVNRLGLE